jgi:hypothetical protein
MTTKYEVIANDRERLERTARNSIRMLSTLYADRTHFVLELLQNAEDALRRRPHGWCGHRAVKLSLSNQRLRLVHSGMPFDPLDVQAICSVDETTKELTDIGRFGIGFKSVYALTDRPQIHSGQEDFAIEDYIRPVGMSPIERDAEETVLLIPRKPYDESFRSEIEAGLKRLGPNILLFLREIEDIEWNVDGGSSGRYLRGQPEHLGDGVRRVTMIGQAEGRQDVEESWLVLSRPVCAAGGKEAGYVEIEFALARDDQSGQEKLRPVPSSPLVVFFPTVLETHLGFLVQGPYRTTPSRDNVPANDQWNQDLVRETAALLVSALRWLRDHDLLDTPVLRCLPLDQTKFAANSMFSPLFEATKATLISEPLLPCFDAGHVAATGARLARTQELRELLTPTQLTALFGDKQDLHWLSEDITQGRTPELHRYLMQELRIAEITPELTIPKLDKSFLQAQEDGWILELYHFLNGQPALRRRVENLPLIRLEDGSHVPSRVDGQPQAFLPTSITTGFPTARASVCSTDVAREFLRSLGLTEPDPVDDVVRNVLPKYSGKNLSVNKNDYEADLSRIVKASATDSHGQREKLIAALRQTAFVMVVDIGDESKWRSKPDSVYLATDRLKELFAGVERMFLVDDAYAALRGEQVRDLLEACGAARYIRPVTAASTFTPEQLRGMRVAAGCESCSSSGPFEDRTLEGLDRLLALLAKLDAVPRRRKAELLWEALGELQDRRGTGVFSGTYRWHYVQPRKASFDAAFVRTLNEIAWVPDADGLLQRPEFVLFDTLGWRPNPFLLSKIHFRPPVMEQLAKKAGIELGVLDLLKKLGLTSVAELQSKLGTLGFELPEAPSSSISVETALGKLLGNAPPPTRPVPDPGGEEPTAATSGTGGGDRGVPGRFGGHAQATTGPNASTQAGAHPGGSESGGANRSAASTGSRPFISYIGAHPTDEEPDPDGLDQKARMALEEKAIKLTLSAEPGLQRTPTHNPGFDLFERNPDGQPIRWVEVKAMTVDLSNRPVGISHTQFECAREHGNAYWLYVVEHADDRDARIVCIQDPTRKTRTFTFDKGWLCVADVHDNVGHSKD